MTGPEFVYPEQGERETSAEYWARVRAMGLPYPWEWDKAVPPGPITVTHEWSLRDPGIHGVGPVDLDSTLTETQARARVARRPGYTLIRRIKWFAVGEWEEVPDA